MICENCGKDNNNSFVYKRHIFCSHKCQEEYYKNKKKIKCRWCGEIFYEVDLIITEEVVPDQPGPIGWDWGIPRWEYYEIRKCPNCKCTYHNIKEKKEVKNKN